MCHAAAFGSFSNGHPDIAERYAFDEPTGLNFDHAAHLDEYFELAGRDGEIHCGTCHVAERSGRHMILNDFDAMCSECHADQIAENEDGIAVLSLPAFAQRFTKQQRESIGLWPEKARADLSPYLQLLLLGDKAYPQDYELRYDLERWSLIEAQGRHVGELTEDETMVVGRLAEAIKRLVDELGDRDGVRMRIERAVGFPISSAESEALLGAMSRSAGFRLGIQHWFSAPSPDVHNEDFQSEYEEAWFREDSTYSVLYFPAHHAASFLRTWLDLVIRVLHNQEEGGLRRRIAVEILHGLEEEASPGSCLKCHRVDYFDSAGRIQWKPNSPSTLGRESTFFTHYPHVGLVGCAGCHERRPEGTTWVDSRLADDVKSGQHTVDFVSIGIHTCSKCHVPELVGDSCLQCHYYHLGKMTRRVGKTAQSSMGPHYD